MPWMPSAARTTNQASITGPKIRPMKPAPCFCMMNRPTRMTIVIGTTAGASDGSSTFSPSIALRSEEHTSELQLRSDLVCRLLLEKKKKKEEHRIIQDRQTKKLDS